MEKIINPIMKKNYNGRYYNVFIKIKFTNGKLSISGVEGPMSNGDCLGSCGQIDMTLSNDNRLDWKFNNEWNDEMMTKLLEIWERWHLNDMKAGTPKQEAFIREWKKENRYDYTKACDALAKAGLLYVEHGYKYGSAWLTEEVPQNVIDWLFNLPNTEIEPAWV
jgi:hypothetical protein